MSRRMNSENAELFRARVTRKRAKRNPDYDWRSDDPAKRVQWLYDESDTYTEFIGPYNTLPAVKGQVTANLFGYQGVLQESVVGFDYQRARIVWETVDLENDCE